MKFTEGSKIIECNSIDLCTKDIIYVKDFKDFVWVVGTSAVFKLKNSYYLLSDAVAYVWVEE